VTVQSELIAALAAKFPGDSQSALAKRAGLSQQRFNNYALGLRTMDVDAVIGCAQVLGLDIRSLVNRHLGETAATPRVRAYWRRLATTAGVVALGCALSLQARAEAYSAPALSMPGDGGSAMYIMRSVSQGAARITAQLARWLATWLQGGAHAHLLAL
jgi:transcriptional regulator with XRE-family HTH domain